MAWVGDIKVPFPNHGGTITSMLWGVAHSLECDAIPGLGEDLCRGYFQNESVSVQTVSDPKNNVAGLDTGTKGYHAGATGNAHGNSDEVTGRAAWTRNQWLESNPNKALDNQARALAEFGKTNGFRPEDYRWLSVAEVKSQSVRGFCYHYDISRAFGESSHWDPGTGYPADIQMDRIRFYAGVQNYWGKPTPKPDNDPAPATPVGGAETEEFPMNDEVKARFDAIEGKVDAIALHVSELQNAIERDPNNSVQERLDGVLDALHRLEAK